MTSSIHGHEHSHRRVNLNEDGLGGDLSRLLTGLQQPGADQREAREAYKLEWFSFSLERFWFMPDRRTRLIADQREAQTESPK